MSGPDLHRREALARRGAAASPEGSAFGRVPTPYHARAQLAYWRARPPTRVRSIRSSMVLPRFVVPEETQALVPVEKMRAVTLGAAQAGVARPRSQVQRLR